MTVKSVKQQNCEHKFITKGSVHAFVRECTKCGWYEVCVG
ncbi:hypothetical protein P7_105 [Pectobacterium phage vB_PcaM_P7_Pc]|nr:DNA-directed RNA polymerase subunit [Pectobacterium phage PcCB7V]UTC25295.1 hypothetical protein P7_105 [Pectobacterium phage vB_PcaM_P7_Pc]